MFNSKTPHHHSHKFNILLVKFLHNRASNDPKTLEFVRIDSHQVIEAKSYNPSCFVQFLEAIWVRKIVLLMRSLPLYLVQTLS